MKSNSDMYKKVMRLLEGSKDESLLEELRENEGDLMDYLTEEMPERKGSVMIMIKKGKKGDDLEEMFPEKDNPRTKFPEFKRGGEVKKKKPKITFKKKKGFGTKWENKWG